MSDTGRGRRGPADRALPRLSRRGGRRRQDLRHARRGVAPLPARRRRGRRVRRDPQAALHHGADPGPPGRAAQAGRVPGLGVGGDGPRRRTGPQARGGAHRRAGPHQRARARAATRSDGRTCSRSSMPASPSSRRSTSSTSSRWPTPSSGSPASACASGCRTGWCGEADQIELIDSSADQLRRRMLHGNIYPEAKVPAALNGFFRAENLVALRELSLRFVADETEEELLEYLRSKGAGGELWETTERIMVAVTGAPGNASVIRRAARIAARVKAPLVAVHVVSGRRRATSGATRPSSRSWWRRSAAPGRRSRATTWPRRSSPPPSTSRSPRSSSAPHGSPAGSR